MPDRFDDSVADRISEILKFEAERAENVAKRLRAHGIWSAQDDLSKLFLNELDSAALTELEAIKLRTRWIPDTGKYKVTSNQEEHIRLLKECKHDLEIELIVDKELIDKLKKDDVVTSDEIVRIESATRNELKVYEVVQALQKEGDKYEKFLRVINTDRYRPVFNILQEKKHDIARAFQKADRQRTEYVLLKKIDDMQTKIDDISKLKEATSEEVKCLKSDLTNLNERINELQASLNTQKIELRALEEKYKVALFEEVKSGTLEQFIRFLNPTRDINKDKDEDGRSALHLASSIGNSEKVKHLLEEVHADHKLKDKDGNTALHLASKEGNIDCMAKLISCDDADPNAQNSEGQTPLFSAVVRLQPRSIEKLLSCHGRVKVDMANVHGCTPLYMAARNGSMDELRLLTLERHGANINAERDDGTTPLYAAIESNSPNAAEVVELLLEKGADVEKTYRDGTAPLHMAAFKGSYAICEILLNSGVEVNGKKTNDATALHIAAAANHTKVMSLLLARGANIEARKEDQRTPLFSAAYKGKTEAVILLLAKGALINAQKADGETPLLCAITNDKLAVVKILLDHNANKNMTYATSGDTVLHEAARVENTEMVKMLIAAKADYKENENRKKPSDVETKQEIILLLQQYEKQCMWRNRPRTHSEGHLRPHMTGGDYRKSLEDPVDEEDSN